MSTHVAAPPNRGRTGIRVTLVVAATLLLLGTLGGLTAAAVGLGSTRVTADSRPLPSTMRSLTVDTAELPVTLRLRSDPQADRPRVEMRLVSPAGARPQHLEIDAGQPEVRITVRGEESRWVDWAQAGQLTVVLPPALAADLSVQTTHQAGILLVDTALRALVTHTTHGAVILNGAAGSVEVHTEHGMVATRSPIAVRESFVADSVDGDIRVDIDVDNADVDNAQAPTRIEAVTGNGDVRIGLPRRGPYAVTAQAGYLGGTTIAVEQTRDPGRALATVVARSSTGSVTVDERD
ncbi:DUF4097 family beta strand repeat-containing protein [Mycolicibacterium palauense]|uniref:hypothetical protein n=1 Tax=Mycolicibacterium palauense TaxID=2034511 RepID=UPI000BFEDC52|nr:hypothetical protein [Mycolicibacterium palauense]